MNAFGDDRRAGASGNAQGHQDRLGQGAAPVVQAGIGHLHARELADERLVFEENLQASLAGFRLVGRIGRVVFAPAGDGVHHRRDEMVVTAATQKTDRIASRPIPARQLLHVLAQFDFRQGRRDVQRSVETKLGGNRGEQLLDRLGADLLQHRLPVGRSV